jgi:hypothetical protein
MCWLTGRRDVSNGRTGHPRKEEPCPLAHRVPPADLLHSEGPKPRDGQLARSRQSAMPPQPRMRGVFQHTTPSAKLRNRERGQPWILIFADPRQISPGSAGRVRHDRVGSRVLPRVALRIPAFHVRHGRVGPAGIDVQSGYAFHAPRTTRGAGAPRTVVPVTRPIWRAPKWAPQTRGPTRTGRQPKRAPKGAGTARGFPGTTPGEVRSVCGRPTDYEGPRGPGAICPGGVLVGL